MRRQNGFARIRVALGNFRGDFHEAAIFELAHGGGGGFGEREQFGQQHFAAFLDNIPNVLLTLWQFRKFTARRQRADEQLFFPAISFLADGFGQNAFQRRLRRAAIILGNPAREFQHLGRDERLRADDFENGLEICVTGFFGNGGDDAENFARPERHLHPAADINLSSQPRRNEVIEFLPQRDFQADAGDHKPVTGDE